MQKVKHSWFKLPSKIRKPVVLVVGLIFIIAAGLTGWLPGPGGIPLFLIGIAILATEFEWAERIRDYALQFIKNFAHWYKINRVIGTLVLVLCASFFATIAYLSYRSFVQ